MKFLRGIGFALILLLVSVAPSSAVERIIAFISDVTVQRDGELAVAETIRVEAEGKIIRRGIFRDFPTVYTRRDGTRVEVGFRLESVTRDGVAENAVVERINNGVRIRIGRADRLLPPGQYSYVIRYRTTRQVGFFESFDELYWNATGTGWAFPIEMAEARITLPEAVPFGQTAFYTGPQGAVGKDAQVVEQVPGRIVFRTTRALPPRSGLTVAASWRKGVIEPPTSAQRAQYWLSDNRGLAIAAIGFLLIVPFYGFAWHRVGRDPPTGTIIPLFAPPDNMSPAAARYVDRMSFDNHCFTAAIVNLGVRGHLRITEDGSKATLERRDGGQPVSSEEQAMAARLFSGRDTLLLTQTNHVPLGKSKEILSDELSKAYLGKLFANNYAWSGLGFVLVALLAAAVIWAVHSAHRYSLMAAVIVACIIGGLLVMTGAGMAFVGWQRGRRGRWLFIGGVTMVIVGTVAALFFTLATDPGLANLAMIGILLALSALAGIGFPWLKAPSRSGRKIMDQIEGFREYLSVAEEDRLNALNQPAKTPELFERFLPYAIALDCQNAWAAKFTTVLAAAGTAAAAAGWYVGSRDWTRDPVSFADHIGSSLASTISSSSTAPGSSSGSGGGGSSGGGGGGGGGGGW